MADKKTKPAETKPKTEKKTTTQTDIAPEQSKPKWNAGNVFWGLLLVLLGTLFLLDNFNVVNVNFVALWNLWPLLIIAAGLSVLAVRGWLMALIVGFLVALMLGMTAMVSFGMIGPMAPETTTSTVNLDNNQKDNIKDVNVTISGGAGKIDISSLGGSDKLIEARLDSSIADLEKNISLRNTTQDIELLITPRERWMHGGQQNDLTVELTEQLPVSLELETGASKVNADLSKVQLKNLTIESGASSVELKLGDRYPQLKVNLNVGMTSTKIMVPRGTGISLSVDSGLSSRDTEGLTEIRDGYFESSNYSTASNKIDITGDMGMSSFEIEYY